MLTLARAVKDGGAFGLQGHKRRLDLVKAALLVGGEVVRHLSLAALNDGMAAVGPMIGNKTCGDRVASAEFVDNNPVGGGGGYVVSHLVSPESAGAEAPRVRRLRRTRLKVHSESGLDSFPRYRKPHGNQRAGRVHTIAP